MGFGMVMVWSASSVLAQDRHGSPYYFLVKQALWGVIGIGGMVAALRLDYRAAASARGRLRPARRLDAAPDRACSS